MGPEEYQKSLDFVITFLSKEGFSNTITTLQEELLAKSPSNLSLDETQLSAPTSSNNGAEYAQPPSPYSEETNGQCSANTTPLSVDSISADLDSRFYAEMDVAQCAPGRASDSSSRGLEQAEANQTMPPMNKPLCKQPVDWASEVDEYENQDDVGYHRRDIAAQQQFVEVELDLDSDHGSDHGINQSASLANADAASESFCTDNELPGVLLESTESANGGPELYVKDNADEAWDKGPTDIKFAEPVTTPSKSASRPDEPKPVLSRVESLSSSFKDFDIERTDEEIYSGRLSVGQLEDQLLAAEGIEFPAVPLAVVTPEDLALFGQQQPQRSKASSIEAMEGSVACMSEPGPTFGTTDAIMSKPRHLSAPVGLEDAKEAVGGFSFPVTPPAADEPDSRLFKSWPSVRSSCTSEVLAASDDDNNAADYADEDYSKSKLSSRSPSQSLSIELLQRPPFAGDGVTDWEFATAPHPISTSREPSLDCPSEAGSGKEVSRSVPTAMPSGDGPERKGVGSVVAHMIKLSIDDLHEHDHDQVSATASPSGSQPASPLSPQHRSGSQQQEQQAVQQEDADASDDEAGSQGEEDEQSGCTEDDEEDDEDIDGGREYVTDAQEPVAWEEVLLPQDIGTAAMEGTSDDIMPRYTIDESGVLLYVYDPEFIARKYEILSLRIIHRRQRTGFEETKDFPIRLNDLIAGRYQVMDFLGSAAFSRAVQALDVQTNTLVCLKIIKNNKDYFDQSLDEIKLLNYVKGKDPNDEYGIVRLYDYFYYKEHLFLVCELLRANLYEFQKYNKESGDNAYFTNARIQLIAKQVLVSLSFLHSLGLVHSDLKPENILIKSYSKCEVKVIDLGSSCFTSDQLSSYVQSRSYRAPEVILGLPYDQKIDIWSLGCILAELSSGFVLFQNDSLGTLLARLEGILGPVPEWMVRKGRYSNRFYTRSGHLYERSQHTGRYELLVSKRTSLRHRVPDADNGLLDFIAVLLTTDPHKRPTAEEALQHPWLQHEYPGLDD